MKVAVTGGQGFIGRWICQRLLAEGHSPVVIDRRILDRERLYPPIGDVEFFLGDVLDPVAMMEVAAHVDGIVHLAAVLGTQETIKNPIPSALTNTIGALNVFEAANHYDLPVVYAGVGNHWMRDHGTGSYTISKTAAEDYARMMNAYRDGRISVVRPVNAYGPGQSTAAPYGPSKVRKIIPAFVCRALTGSPIEVYGDGTQISDCVYVEDVARIFVRALEYTSKMGPLAQAAEVGPIDSYSVNSVADLVRHSAAEFLGHDSPVDLVHLPMRPGEVPNSVVKADVSTLAELGDDVQADTFVSLAEGVSRSVLYFGERWLPTYQ